MQKGVDINMDNAIKIAVGIGGGLASYLFGGWSVLLQTLVVFIVLDYVFAIVVAATHGELNSKKGFKRIAKKVGILVLVAAAHQVDSVLGDGSLVRDSVIFFYIANGGLSIVETVGKTKFTIADELRRADDPLNSNGAGK